MILLPPRSTFFPYTTLFRSGHTVEFYCHSAAEVDAADDDTHSWRAYAGREIINDRCRANYGEVVGRGRAPGCGLNRDRRSEEHTSELQSRLHLVCRLLLEKK